MTGIILNILSSFLTPNYYDASDDFAGALLLTLEAPEGDIAAAQAKQDALDTVEAEKAEATKNLEINLAVRGTTYSIRFAFYVREMYNFIEQK